MILRLLLPLIFAAPFQDGAVPVQFPKLAPERLRRDVAVLAADEMGGRRTGEPGEQMAADLIQRRFEKIGLQPVGGAFQHAFPASPRWLDSERTVLELAGDERFPEGEQFPPGNDYRPHPGAPEGDVTGPVVFVGYGLRSLAYEYDDFDGVELEGSVALIFRWEPQAADRRSRFDGRSFLPETRLAEKIRECQRRGVLAVLVADPPGVSDSLDAPGGIYWPSGSPLYGQIKSGMQASADKLELARTNFSLEDAADQLFLSMQNSAMLAVSIPVAYVSRHAVDLIFQAAGRDGERWVREVDERESSDSFPTPLSARVSVHWKPAALTGRNVLGVLPGSDPRLRDEYVVLSAHFDHVGRNETEIWNGADDNASGTAALLGLAESFAASENRPRRSLLFAAWSGEELGLVGSAWFFGQALVDPGRVAAMVNMDMVGRSINGIVYVVGTRSAEGLKGIVQRAAEGLRVTPVFDNDEFFSRSDQLAFYKHGVPVIFFNTDEHPDYHRPSDTWERIQYASMSSIAVLARRTLRTLADLPERLPFHEDYRYQHPAFGRSPDLNLLPWPVRAEDRMDY